MGFINLENYATFIFDCDGVILDSNKLKSEAFRKAVLPYGKVLADAFVEYHKQNGGISRQRKFTYFLENMVQGQFDSSDLEKLLNRYADIVLSELYECQITPDLFELRELTNSAKWFVVSGGSQSELRDVFNNRNIAKLFEGGIFGNPDSKEEILTREIQSGKIRLPAIMFGDSKYDHIAAKQHDIDFVFVSDWTEFSDWQLYCSENDILNINRLSNLIS